MVLSAFDERKACPRVDRMGEGEEVAEGWWFEVTVT
jgi:hypothetical protein